MLTGTSRPTTTCCFCRAAARASSPPSPSTSCPTSRTWPPTTSSPAAGQPRPLRRPRSMARSTRSSPNPPSSQVCGLSTSALCSWYLLVSLFVKLMCLYFMLVNCVCFVFVSAACFCICIKCVYPVICGFFLLLFFFFHYCNLSMYGKLLVISSLSDTPNWWGRHIKK